MIKEYVIENIHGGGNGLVTKFDGDDMLRVMHKLVNPKHLFPDDVLLQLYRYAISVEVAGIRTYLFMCANEMPSSINDSMKYVIVFRPNRYVNKLNKESSSFMTNLWHVPSASAFLMYEKLYGDEDSFYKRIISDLDGLDCLYIVNEYMGEIEKINITFNGEFGGMFIRNNFETIDLGITVSAKKNLRDCINVFDITADGAIIAGYGGGGFATYHSKRINEKGELEYPVFMDIKKAEAELLSIRDRVRNRLESDIQHYRSQITKRVGIINKLNRLK